MSTQKTKSIKHPSPQSRTDAQNGDQGGRSKKMEIPTFELFKAMQRKYSPMWICGTFK